MRQGALPCRDFGKGLGGLGFLYQKSFQSYLPVLERFLQLADKEKILRPLAENTKSNFIADHIPHDCSIRAFASPRQIHVDDNKDLKGPFFWTSSK